MAAYLSGSGGNGTGNSLTRRSDVRSVCLRSTLSSNTFAEKRVAATPSPVNPAE